MENLDGGYGWVIVVCCFYGQMVFAGYFFSAGVFYPSWVEDFESSRGLTSWVVALCIGTCNGFGPIFAAMVTKFGHRPVMMAGALLSAGGFFLSAFATSIYSLIVLAGFVGGFGFGMVYLPSHSIIPHYFHKRRSLALGIILCGTGVGNFLYPPFLSWLEDQVHWRGSVMIVSGLMLNTIVCGALVRPAPTPTNETKDEQLTEQSCGSKVKGGEDSTSHLSQSETSCSEIRSFPEEIQNTGKPNYCRIVTSGRNVSEIIPDGEKTLSVRDDIAPNDVDEAGDQLQPLVASDKAVDELKNVPCATKDTSKTISEYSESEPDYLEYHCRNKSCQDCVRSLNDKNTPIEDSMNKDLSLGSSKNICGQTFTRFSENRATHCEPPTSSNHSKTSHSDQCCSLFSCFASSVLHLKDTIRLLKNPFYAVFAVNNFLICLTFLMPPVYMADRAIESGVSKTRAALALSMYGAGNMFGRLGIGMLADLGTFDILTLISTCMMISGVSTCVSPLCGANAVLHGLYGFTFGTFIGGMLTLSPFFLVELLGISSLNSSLGLIFMFRAIGMILGTPMAGWIYDFTSSYTASFLINGILMCVTSLILIGLKVTLRHSKSHTAVSTIEVADGVEESADA